MLESKKEYEKDYKQIKIYVGLLNDLASLFGLAIIIYSGYSSVDSNSKTQESSNTQSLNWSAIGSAIGGIFPWFIMFTISQMINHWRIHKVQTILENYQHERQNLTSSIHWTLLTRYQIFCQLAIQDIFTDQKLAHEVALRWIAEKVSYHFDDNAKKALNDTGAVLSTTISFLKNRTLYSRLYMDVLPMFLLLLFMVIGGFLGQLTKPDQSVVIVQICALILLGLMAVLARFVPAASQFLSRGDLDKTINALEMVGLVENSARMLFNDLKESLSQADYSQIDQILTNNLSSPAYQVSIIPDDQILSKRATYSLQSNTPVVIKNSASIFFAPSSRFFEAAINNGTKAINEHLSHELDSLKNKIMQLYQDRHLVLYSDKLIKMHDNIAKQAKFDPMKNKLTQIMASLPENDNSVETVRTKINQAIILIDNLKLRQECYNDALDVRQRHGCG